LGLLLLGARTEASATWSGTVAEPRPGLKKLLPRDKAAPIRLESLVAPEELTPEALFGNELKPDLRSFRQGRAGDCYALSAARVYANPESKFYDQQIDVIKSVFLTPDGKLRRSKAGIPQARFFRKDRATGRYRAVFIDYDGRVPMRNGKPVFATEAYKNGQAWGPLFEVVYTKFRDQEGGARNKGYDRTGNGGHSYHVFPALTGRDAQHFDVTPENLSASMKVLRDALRRGDVVTSSSTRTAAEMLDRADRAIALGLLSPQARNFKFDDEKLVVKNHEYALLGTPKKGVTLGNPWNIWPVGRRGRKGIGTIKEALYSVLYSHFAIGAGSALGSRRGR
jgi:hypothetical protein